MPRANVGQAESKNRVKNDEESHSPAGNSQNERKRGEGEDGRPMGRGVSLGAEVITQQR